MESGGEAGGRASRCESLQPFVKRTKPKDADRLEPKGTWSACPDVYSGHMDAMTTGERRA